MKNRNNFKYTVSFQQVVFGDFSKEEKSNNIPSIGQSAYIIKCVLHNIPDKKEIISILQRISKKMGENSQLFLAERALTADDCKPHFNRLSNLLMQILFKANSRSLPFYISCLKDGGFSMTLTKLDSGNYTIIGGEPIIHKPSIFKERSQSEEPTLNRPQFTSRL